MHKLEEFIDEYAKTLRLPTADVENILINFIQNQLALSTKSTPSKIKSLSLKKTVQIEEIKKNRVHLEKLEKDFEANRKILEELRLHLLEIEGKRQKLLQEKQQLEFDLKNLKKENQYLDYENQMKFAKINSESSNIKFVHIILIVFSVLGVLLAIIFSIFKK